MGVTIASFIAMAIAARQLSGMSTFEVLFFRSLVTLLVMLPLVLTAGARTFSTVRLGLHLCRNLVHFTGQFGWIYGIAVLPLAEVTSLEFTGPLWAAILAAITLGEKVAPHRWLATGVGFGGVLLILRPGAMTPSLAALAVLASGLCYGGSAVMVKALTRTDDARVIVLYMAVIQLPLGLIPALVAWVPPSRTDAPCLFLLGLSGLSAHYAMARALSLADTTVVLPIDFLRLPVIALVGLLAYAEIPSAWAIAGAGVMFGANYYSVWRESRVRRRR